MDVNNLATIRIHLLKFIENILNRLCVYLETSGKNFLFRYNIMCSKCCCDKKDPCCCEPVMTDCLAKKIECVWKQAFCDAKILPEIGWPSCNDCVMTLTHSLGKCAQKLKINGLCSNSILANNEFYSAEVSGCKWLNLYQIQIPDIAGKCGCKSSGEVYVEALVKLGISVDGNSYNWNGTCPHMLSIHSKAIGMDPLEFSKKQIAAIKATMEYFANNCCQKTCGCCN
jgi:hypothetical protein